MGVTRPSCAYVSENRRQGLGQSTSSNAVLRAYVTSTNTLIGTLTNNGGGRYELRITWPSDPQNTTVRSSLGCSATRTVTVR